MPFEQKSFSREAGIFLCILTILKHFILIIIHISSAQVHRVCSGDLQYNYDLFRTGNVLAVGCSILTTGSHLQEQPQTSLDLRVNLAKFGLADTSVIVRRVCVGAYTPVFSA